MTEHNAHEILFDGARYDVGAGLTTEQVASSRAKYGRNELTPPERAPWWRELLEGFDDPTIKILLGAACLSLAVTAIEKFALKNADASFIDTLGIFIAVALATLVAFFSERKSENEFEALNKIRDDIPIKTYRNGQLCETHIGEIVVGDVVELFAGDKSPADGVILETSNLYADESTFTGESLAARKFATTAIWDLSSLRESVKLGDASFLPRGATIADGRAIMVVTRVGDESEMGKIASALATSGLDDSETPLTQKLAKLANQISVLGVSAATLIFTIMNLVAAVKSPVACELFGSAPGALGSVALALVLGYVLERFLARPFFSSMGTPLESKRILALVFIPCVIAVWTALAGVWGLMSESLVASGLELLKSVLLSFVVAVTIIVVAVPEGLPMMTTISLALNMRKMARENCLVRKLIASETIGSATVVCTDKTGTLTQNIMTPTSAYCDGRAFPSERFPDMRNVASWRRLVRGIACNSRANLHVEQPGEEDSFRNDAQTVGNAQTGEIAVAMGNPTEGALLIFLYLEGIDYRRERAQSSGAFFELEHNSARKYSAVAYESESEGALCLIKGAPELMVKRCSSIIVDDEARPIAEYSDSIENFLRASSEKALRTLGFCEKRLTAEERRALESGTDEERAQVLEDSNFSLVGFIGIMDPPRPEAGPAVKRCQGAGIEVKMITGDSLPTAIAIAKEVGIYDENGDKIATTSAEFAKVSDDELPEFVEKLSVLARSTPNDKLRIVQALHRKGEVVAMTGDGTNDAPALKAADVGLAMGVSGTEVAKEAADIILVDDNFRSVATGVWWGRSLFQNIRRFLQFQLSVNFVALLCSTIGPLVGVPLPLTVTQLLWINIIMDTFAALALSTDPPRPYIMKRKPIPRLANVVTKSMGVSILVVGLYQTLILFAALWGGWFVTGTPFSTSGSDAENLEALTVFFTILVMFQFWHKFNCRALTYDESPFALLLKNKMFLAIVLSITALQIVMVQIHAVGEFFRTTPLEFMQWIKIIALTATVIPVAWFGRWLAHWLGFDREEA